MFWVTVEYGSLLTSGPALYVNLNALTQSFINIHLHIKTLTYSVVFNYLTIIIFPQKFESLKGSLFSFD